MYWGSMNLCRDIYSQDFLFTLVTSEPFCLQQRGKYPQKQITISLLAFNF